MHYFAKALSILLAGLIVTQPALAQVVTDRTAPTSQRPQILTTASGVTQVDIATPNGKGVSHNTYTQFDVSSQGVILNNGMNASNTAIGGWVAGNPNLARGTARVILNEVNSNDPSRLNGYVEVAGDKAQVVIANPSGITCTGCGFINANRVTLATGSVQKDASGNISTYRVEDGTILIDGAGMDASGADYTDVIARAVKVKGAVYAQDLKVTAGANEVSADHSSVKSITGKGTAPAVAIDSSELGGMYAGKIRFIVTDKGAGVSNAGNLMSADEIAITADGRVVNKGTIAAKGHVKITSRQGIENQKQGVIYSKKTIQAKTKAPIVNGGTIAAASDVSLVASKDTTDPTILPSIQNQAGGMIIAGLSDTGGLTGSATLTLQAEDALNNQGSIFSSGASNVLLGSNLFDNTGGIFVAGGVFTIQAGDIKNLSNATIASGGDMSLHASGITQDATSQLVSMANADLNVTGAIDNNGVLGATKALTITADTVHNRTIPPSSATSLGQGGIIEANNLTITANNLQNDADSTDPTVQGILLGQSALTLNIANSLTNPGLIAGGVAQITTQDLKLQGQGQLIGNDLTVKANSFTNDAKTQVIGANSLTMDVASAWSNPGLIEAGTLIINAPKISNIGTGQIIGNKVTLTAPIIDNQVDAQIIGAQTLNINAANALTNRGLINGGLVRIDAKDLTNIGTGRIYGDHISLGATNLLNDAETLNGVTSTATIAARLQLDIGASNITNREGATLLSLGDINIAGALDKNGFIDPAVAATLLDNRSALINAAGNIYINATTLNNVNDHFTTHIQTLSQEQLTQYQPMPNGRNMGYGLYNHDQIIWGQNSQNDAPTILAIRNPDGTLTNFPGDGGDYSYNTYNYTRTTQETQVDESRPAEITAGGKMVLNVEHGTNDKSLILVGGNYYDLGTNFNNIAALGQHIVTDSGTYQYRTLVECGFLITYTCKSFGPIQPYHPPATVTTITLPLVPNANPAAPPGTPGTLSNLPQVANVNLPNVTGTIKLPNSSLYKINTDPNSHYLVQTDPAFTNYGKWLSSDYMLTRLGTDPNFMQKRLGDGFYEEMLVADQIAKLTGHKFLVGYGDNTSEYQALMDAGVTFAQKFKLTVGVELTAEQVAQLTSDIVWLVTESVTMPDGTTQQVLVPKVYLMPREGDVAPTGTLISANAININLSGDLMNSGTINGRQITLINANTINNLSGNISGNIVAMNAVQDINNIGGTIAGNDVLLSAGRDINMASTTQTTNVAGGTRTNLDRIAGVYGNGIVAIQAGQDVNLNAAQVVNSAAPDQSLTVITAGRDVNMGTVTTNYEYKSGDKTNFDSDKKRQDAGSVVISQGDVAVQAGRDINTKAATINSTQGAVDLQASRDINVTNGEAYEYHESNRKVVTDNFLSTTTRTDYSKIENSQAIGSSIEGKTVNLHAGQDINVKGSNVVSDQGTQIVAGRDVNVVSATNTYSDTYNHSEKTTGIFSSGGIGITIGQKKLSTDTTTTGTQNAASTIGAVNGDVLIFAGRAYKQIASNVMAPNGSIGIVAQSIDVLAGQDTQTMDSVTKFSQSGLTISLSNPILNAGLTAVSMYNAANKTSDTRMKALAGGATVFAAYNAYQSVKQDPQALGGIGINVSIGSSKSKQESHSDSTIAVASTISAGKNVTLIATGAGDKSNINVIGSDIKAGGDILLKADNQINLQAAKNTTNSWDKNSSSGWSVGVGVNLGSSGIGVSVFGNINGANGKGSGSDISWRNTHVDAGGTLTMISGGDLILKGATASGNKVVADVGRNLIIESMQDTSSYNYHSTSYGAGVSIGVYGVGAGSLGGSLSYGNTNIKNDFKSVTEVSGIKAGDGGFDVKVKGDTTIKGGVIASTDKAVNDGKNAFTTGGKLTVTDLENSSQYKGSSTGVTIGVGSMKQASGAGHGSMGDSEKSITTAGISGIAGDKYLRSDYTGNALKSTFDAQKVKDDLAAQVTITTEFNKGAAKAVGDYATSKLKEAQDLRQKAAQTQDPTQKQALLDQANQIETTWGEGGAGRVALHAIVGGLSGDLSGALGAAGSQLAIPLIANEINKLDVPEPVKQALLQGLSAGIGAALGGVNGMTSGLTATAQNYLTHAQLDDLRKKLAACQGQSYESCAKPLLDDAKVLSKEQDEALKAACAADSNSSACTGGVKEALDYAYERNTLNGGKSVFGFPLSSGIALLDIYKQADAALNEDRLSSGNTLMQIVLAQADGYKYFTTVTNRKEFFAVYSNAMQSIGNEEQWTRAAEGVLSQVQLAYLEYPPGSPYYVDWADRVGNSLLIDAWGPLKNVYFSTSPLTGDAALQWDFQMVRREQNQLEGIYQVMAPPWQASLGGFFATGNYNFNLRDLNQRIEYGDSQILKLHNNTNQK